MGNSNISKVLPTRNTLVVFMITLVIASSTLSGLFGYFYSEKAIENSNTKKYDDGFKDGYIQGFSEGNSENETLIEQNITTINFNMSGNSPYFQKQMQRSIPNWEYEKNLHAVRNNSIYRTQYDSSIIYIAIPFSPADFCAIDEVVNNKVRLSAIRFDMGTSWNNFIVYIDDRGDDYFNSPLCNIGVQNGIPQDNNYKTIEFEYDRTYYFLFPNHIQDLSYSMYLSNDPYFSIQEVRSDYGLNFCNTYFAMNLTFVSGVDRNIIQTPASFFNNTFILINERCMRIPLNLSSYSSHYLNSISFIVEYDSHYDISVEYYLMYDNVFGDNRRISYSSFSFSQGINTITFYTYDNYGNQLGIPIWSDMSPSLYFMFSENVIEANLKFGLSDQGSNVQYNDSNILMDRSSLVPYYFEDYEFNIAFNMTLYNGIISTTHSDLNYLFEQQPMVISCIAGIIDADLDLLKIKANSVKFEMYLWKNLQNKSFSFVCNEQMFIYDLFNSESFIDDDVTFEFLFYQEIYHLQAEIPPWFDILNCQKTRNITITILSISEFPDWRYMEDVKIFTLSINGYLFHIITGYNTK